MRRRSMWVMVLLALCLTASTAFGQAKMSSVVTFGDSLTNNDFLGAVYGNPQDMYGADPMEAVFDKAPGSGNNLMSYAVAGSTADDLPTQIDAYRLAVLTGIQDKATLFSLEIGGNDFIDNIDLLAGSAPGKDSAADAVVNNVIRKMKNGWLKLRQDNRQAQFVIWTIPDVTLIPKFWGQFDARQVAHVRAHLDRFNNYVRSLDRYPFIVVLDLYALVQKIVVTPPVFFNHPLTPPPSYAHYDTIFADKIHPTAVSNGVIANNVIRKINRKWSDRIPVYTQAQLATLAHIAH